MNIGIVEYLLRNAGIVLENLLRNTGILEWQNYHLEQCKTGRSENIWNIKLL